MEPEDNSHTQNKIQNTNICVLRDLIREAGHQTLPCGCRVNKKGKLIVVDRFCVKH
jgi:hypothetical protein